MQEGRKESDECRDIPSLEFHETDLSPAGPDETDDRVRTLVVLREPPFTGYGTETGTETGGEASEPKAIDDNRGTGWPEGSGWVGDIFKVWVPAVQNLVKEYG